MIYKGKYLNKEVWFSICSMHSEYKPSCKMCNVGGWNNLLLWKISNTIYKLSPKVWRWLVNL